MRLPEANVQRALGDARPDPATAPLQAPLSPDTRILFLIGGLTRGGAELRLLDFARKFPASTDMHIYVLSDHVSMREEFEATRAKVHVLPIRRAYLEWRRVREVLEYIRTHDLRVINAFDLKSLVVAVAARLKYGSKIRVVYHIIGLWRDLVWHQKRVMWRLIDFVDVVVCNGEAVEREVLGMRRIRARVATIPNGVDCIHFSNSPQLRAAARARLGYPDDTFVLGTVANFHAVKNYPFLIRCMRRLAEQHSHLHLLCVGGGTELEATKQLVRALGIEGRVTFTGSVLDVRSELAAMDAFALCSVTEGCPNALMQAMAMSIPSVASTVGEVPYLVVDGESGILFRLPDEDRFCQAVSRLISEPAFRARVAAQGRQRMETTYSIERMLESYLTMLQGLEQETRAGSLPE